MNKTNISRFALKPVHDLSDLLFFVTNIGHNRKSDGFFYISCAHFSKVVALSKSIPIHLQHSTNISFLHVYMTGELVQGYKFIHPLWTIYLIILTTYIYR